jgi:hypothetical protein
VFVEVGVGDNPDVEVGVFVFVGVIVLVGVGVIDGVGDGLGAGGTTEPS